MRDTPRLRFDYPAHLRAAKRAPLLFDGQRVAARRRPRRSRPLRAAAAPAQRAVSGRQRPARADRRCSTAGRSSPRRRCRLGGVGFYLRSDRTIWVFVDGQPLVLRRGEHWTAFPLELTSFIAQPDRRWRRDRASSCRAALNISAQGRGAILAIVDVGRLARRRSSRRRTATTCATSSTRRAIRTETRLHHLIDAEDLDEQTLTRLAGLDGATIVDRDANLLAYGAIVTSSDSQHEGAAPRPRRASPTPRTSC